jgi:hypothetical protein
MQPSQKLKEDAMDVDVTKLTTAQEIFDVVAEHLLTMPHRAVNEDELCAYRGKDNIPCAVGRLITDEEYHLPNGETLDDLDDNSVLLVAEQLLLPSRLVPHVKLLTSLQSAHDHALNWQDLGRGPADKKKMRARLIRIADAYDLSDQVIDRFS